MRALLVLLAICTLVTATVLTTHAHSGRTDASGGHRDNNNVSGLGSYHYHHGYPAHLHSGGVCPYENVSAKVETDSAPAPKSNQNTSIDAQTNVYTTAIVEAAEQSLNTAKQNGQSLAIVSLSDQNQLTIGTMQQIAKMANEAGIPIKIYCDSYAGSSVQIRLVVTPSSATKTILLSGSKTSEQAERVKTNYQRWYRNTVEVFSLDERENFGMPVELVLKIDASLFEGDPSIVYVYQESTNSHVQISSDLVYVDENGFLHLTTSLAGDFVVTDKPLSSQ